MSEEREVSPKDLVVEKNYGQEDIDIPKNDDHEEQEEPRVSFLFSPSKFKMKPI